MIGDEYSGEEYCEYESYPIYKTKNEKAGDHVIHIEVRFSDNPKYPQYLTFFSGICPQKHISEYKNPHFCRISLYEPAYIRFGDNDDYVLNDSDKIILMRVVDDKWEEILFDIIHCHFCNEENTDYLKEFLSKKMENAPDYYELK